MPESERQPILLVLGMHRSGTSLCANMLAALGADMAEWPGQGPHNPRGHWERDFVVSLNDRLFALYGRAWADAAHLLAMPERYLDDPRVQAMHLEALAWLRPRLRGPQIFGLKDPRVTRLLPFWNRVFADAGASPRILYCLRDPAQVARSVHARDKIPTAHAEWRWLHYNAAAICALGPRPITLIPYEDWLTHPRETVERLAAGAGLPHPPAHLPGAVFDSDLRHDQPNPPRPLARRLHRAMLRCAETGKIGEELHALCTLIQDMEHQAQPLLVEAEILRVSCTEQARVIADLNHLIDQLRPARAA